MRSLPCALLFVACTAPPSIDALEVTDAEAVAAAGIPTIPDASAPVPSIPTSTDPAPRLQLVRHAAHGDCDYDVVALGFPAVRHDGTQHAFVQHHDEAGADYGGAMTLETRAHDDTVIASTSVYDADAIQEATDGAWGKACRDARAEIQHRITAINATFATGWRPMTRVPVQWPWYIAGGPQLPELSELGVAAHARPVEALYHAGHFVARVRGVKVLQSTPMPGWRGEDPEMTLDATEPTVVALYRDAATDRAVAELSYESGSCMSDPNVYTRAVALEPAVVAAAFDRAAFLLTDPEEMP